LVELWLPYGKTEVMAKIPVENLIGSITGNTLHEVDKPLEEITRAINNPIGGKSLEHIVTSDDKVAIVVEDAIFLSDLLLPLIHTLNQLGIKDSNIAIILGNNLPTYTSTVMLDELANRIKLMPSNLNADDYSYVGDTSRGTKISLKKAFVDADLKILTGRIGFHPYSGYIGRRSGVFPTICSPETIRRSGPLLMNSQSRSGNLKGNPLHQEMEEAAHIAKVDFILNLVLNTNHKIVKAYAGDLDQAFLEAINLINKTFMVQTETLADIAIVSSGGFPSDLTLYQACKALPSALNIVKNGGVIVWIAECSNGNGSRVFYNWMANFGTLNRVKTEVQRRYVLGGEMTYLMLSALQKTKIILVSSIPDYYAAGVFRLRTARTVNTAINSAFRLLGKTSKILALPTGNVVLPISK
jgi:nickel-dependent lactate racemase